MKQLDDYTLDEILLINDKCLLEEYLRHIEMLKSNRINRSIVEKMQGEKLKNIEQAIMEEEFNIISLDLFKGDLVILYPNIKECHTTSTVTCDFSGAKINKGNIYVNYRPLIENITTNTCYVLKRTIKVEPGYISDLPTIIQKLEELKMYMQLEEEYNRINFSHFNKQMGGNLELQKLKRRNYK